MYTSPLLLSAARKRPPLSTKLGLGRPPPSGSARGTTLAGARPNSQSSSTYTLPSFMAGGGGGAGAVPVSSCPRLRPSPPCCGSYTPFSHVCPSQSGSLQNHAGPVSCCLPRRGIGQKVRLTHQGPRREGTAEGVTPRRGSSKAHTRPSPFTPAPSRRGVCVCGGCCQVQRERNHLPLKPV